MIKIVSAIGALSLFAATAAFAQQPSPAPAPGASAARQVLNSIPAGSMTVTNYYQQNVYDPADSKIGEIEDVLISQDGKITGFIVEAGGFLGIGKHYVAVPFDAVKATKKNDKWYLVMNTTKDALKAAPGFKYDKDGNDLDAGRQQSQHHRQALNRTLIPRCGV
jgi:sporulation protein YlmC with PRC-barrel domain